MLQVTDIATYAVNIVLNSNNEARLLLILVDWQSDTIRSTHPEFD